MAATKYPYYGNIRLELVKDILVLWCGYCEKEFLAKLKNGQDDPKYQCPACKTPNNFNIKWKAML